MENKESKAKILLVDDDDSILESLNEILTQEGYETKSAQTGKEAIEACQKDSFDVALIDIKLPDMVGTALLAILKKFNPMLGIIIVTGYPSLETAIESLNSGADGYIVKPFKPFKLLEQIKEQLERHQNVKWENLLKKTGLSAYETKIYLSLVSEGCSEAKSLSIASGVPRTKTYATLKKLIQRGLVLEIPGENQRFSIITPSSGFSSFIQNWKKELSEEAKSLIEFETTMSTLELVKPMNLRQEEVWSIRGRDEIAVRTREVLAKAKVSVCIVTTEKEFVLFYKTLGKMVDDLSDKGVEIRIKVSTESFNKHFVHELKYAYKIEKIQVNAPIFLMIVDEDELIMTSLITADSKNDSNQEFGLLCHGRTICDYLSKLYFLINQKNNLSAYH
jgi:sugar-specific transcriptional regulator TrmB/CheY-like chemotaxis protein